MSAYMFRVNYFSVDKFHLIIENRARFHACKHIKYLFFFFSFFLSFLDIKTNFQSMNDALIVSRQESFQFNIVFSCASIKHIDL